MKTGYSTTAFKIDLLEFPVYRIVFVSVSIDLILAVLLLNLDGWRDAGGVERYHLVALDTVEDVDWRGHTMEIILSLFIIKSHDTFENILELQKFRKGESDSEKSNNVVCLVKTNTSHFEFLNNLQRQDIDGQSFIKKPVFT